MSQYRIKPKKQRPYKPISAGMLNTLADLANDQQIVAGPGVVSFAWPGGTVIQADGATSGAWYFAYTPTTGIPARTGTPPGDLTPGSASCTVYKWTGSALTLVTAKSYATLNAWKTAVGGNKLVRVVYGGGRWWVVNEDCGTGSTSTTPAVQSFSPAFSADFARVTPAAAKPTGTDFAPDFSADYGMSTTSREIWSLSVGGGTPTSGTAGLVAPGGLGTSTLAYNATAVDVRYAIEAIWGYGSVVTSGGPWPGTAIKVIWIGDYDKANVVSASWGGVTLNAGTPALTVTANGAGTGNETQSLYATVNATVGTFVLNLGGYGASGAIAWNCSATTMQAALDAWLGSGKAVAKGGPMPAFPIRITFTGSMGGTNLAAMTLGPFTLGFDGTYAIGTIADGVP